MALYLPSLQTLKLKMPEHNIDSQSPKTFSSLRQRLPDIALESLFIVFALLGALAIDEWRDEQNRSQLAFSAELAIIDELKNNRHQLQENLTKHQEMLRTLERKISKFQADKSEAPNFDFNFSMALLTSAAWDSARMTNAVQNMPLERVNQYSTVYSYQELSITTQNNLIDKLFTIGDLEDSEFVGFTSGFNHRLSILIEVNQELMGLYARTISDFETLTDD